MTSTLTSMTPTTTPTTTTAKPSLTKITSAPPTQMRPPGGFSIRKLIVIIFRLDTIAFVDNIIELNQQTKKQYYINEHDKKHSR